MEHFFDCGATSVVVSLEPWAVIMKLDHAIVDGEDDHGDGEGGQVALHLAGVAGRHKVVDEDARHGVDLVGGAHCKETFGLGVGKPQANYFKKIDAPPCSVAVRTGNKVHGSLAQGIYLSCYLPKMKEVTRRLNIGWFGTSTSTPAMIEIEGVSRRRGDHTEHVTRRRLSPFLQLCIPSV